MLQQPGDHDVGSPIVCVLTRFGLRGRRYMPAMYREYRDVVREAKASEVSGLLCSAFLVENPTTCYSLSFWSEEPFLSAAVPRHVDAARNVFGRLASDPERGPELWSTKWRLSSVTNNLNWEGFDLRQAITAAGGAP